MQGFAVNQRRGSRWAARLLALMLLAGVGQAAELRLYTEEYPPLSFTRQGVADGMAVEVVQALIARTGSAAQIEFVPWTRGYHEVQHQPDTALFATVRTAQREPLFQWVGPIAEGYTGFYTRAGSGLRLRNLADVEAQGTLAVPKQWYSYEVLKAQGLSNLYGVPSPRHMLNMFKHGRIRVLVANSATLRGMLAEHGMTPEEVELQFSFMPSDSYIAFSRSTSPALVARWQAQLQAMKDDGSLAAIAERWVGGEPPRGGRTTP
jgi:polar amino acid transport system substrate-binding protein